MKNFDKSVKGRNGAKQGVFFLFLVTVGFYFLPCGVFAQETEIASKRMAAHHYSVVSAGTERPGAAVLTYPVNEFRVQDYNFLLKLMPCLVTGEDTIFPAAFEDVEVTDVPGAIEGTFSYGNTKIQTRITPLLIGRESKNWSGAVLYEVETNAPEKDVLVYLGGGNTINLIWGFDTSVMKKDTVYPLEQLKFAGNQALNFLGGKEKLNVGVKTSGEISAEAEAGAPPKTFVRISGGEGFVYTAFSDDQQELASLMNRNAGEEKEKVGQYYEQLLASFVKTPEKVMNDAFTSAIYNLEYSWFEPFGWGECLHHWLALWYMQVTAAADWLGQEDRSESSILEHGRQQFENGAIPMFNPNHLTLGMKRRDWGGANNYWLWQIRHYVNHTGDKAFAREIIPYVDRTIRQTLEEYDPDGNNLIAWGLQIGNQEDFVANPYNGSVPSMELYNMFMTRSELAEFTGSPDEAKFWFYRAEQVRKKLYSELWLRDLGRFAYYKDPTERVLLDGQYQTYLYPVIYDIVDHYDQYSGLRHLRDRLTDSEGAVFASNNFAFHVPDGVSTWGMQRGAAQQPWAATGLAKAGFNNAAWKPLRAMARFAQHPGRPGAWPETGPEITPAYFTPPAGLYISTMIEDLFGLRVFEPKGYLEVSPSFPDHWPEAELNLPDFHAGYSREGNTLVYRLRHNRDLPLKVKWRLPVSKITECRVNGKAVAYELLPGVGHVVLAMDVPRSEVTEIKISYDPVEYQVDAPASIAEGDPLDVSLSGATIEKITDRYGVLESHFQKSSRQVHGRIRTGLLKPYREYNQLGQLNFSRRTFFLDCQTPEGTAFIQPVDLAVLPRVNGAVRGQIQKSGGGITVPVTLRNNTREAISGEALVRVSGFHSFVPAKIPARSEKKMDLELPPDVDLRAGDNVLSLKLPGENTLEITFFNPTPGDQSEFVPVDLPREAMMADTLWGDLRIMPGSPHVFFTFSNAQWPEPMWALENQQQIDLKAIGGLSFDIAGRHYIPVSHKYGQTSFRIDLEKQEYRKIFLLLLPMVDNHDIFSEVARVSLYSGNKAVKSRTLHYPGDLDYWVPDKNPTSFSTYREPRENRFEMLPLLKKEEADWKAGTPPAFPQSRWWSSSRVVETESCLMNVVEINLEDPRELDYLVFESLGALPAFGVVAVSAEVSKK